MRFLV